MVSPYPQSTYNLVEGLFFLLPQFQWFLLKLLNRTVEFNLKYLIHHKVISKSSENVCKFIFDLCVNHRLTENYNKVFYIC